MIIRYKTRAVRNEFGQLTGFAQLLVYVSAALTWLVTGAPATVTGVIDGDPSSPDYVHDPDGLHPRGRAWDLRSQDQTGEQKARLLPLLRGLVGLFGGVAILEDRGGLNEHYHLQV